MTCGQPTEERLKSLQQKCKRWSTEESNYRFIADEWKKHDSEWPYINAANSQSEAEASWSFSEVGNVRRAEISIVLLQMTIVRSIREQNEEDLLTFRFMGFREGIIVGNWNEFGNLIDLILNIWCQFPTIKHAPDRKSVV